ncbi:hypothetical protein DY000_02018679 [Brassica cretica]|uniref:Uncharacterized protein n=1 Tax=Brassica cretica TaxID=69181 RepID=A0ABQ7DAC3_BRACR|nr:hypothetical protein DY000_02018679 [Brassica cretica]
MKTLHLDFSVVVQGKTTMLPGCGDQSLSASANLVTKWDSKSLKITEPYRPDHRPYSKDRPTKETLNKRQRRRHPHLSTPVGPQAAGVGFSVPPSTRYHNLCSSSSSSSLVLSSPSPPTSQSL